MRKTSKGLAFGTPQSHSWSLRLDRSRCWGGGLVVSRAFVAEPRTSVLDFGPTLGSADAASPLGGGAVRPNGHLFRPLQIGGRPGSSRESSGKVWPPSLAQIADRSFVLQRERGRRQMPKCSWSITIPDGPADSARWHGAESVDRTWIPCGRA